MIKTIATTYDTFADNNSVLILLMLQLERMKRFCWFVSYFPTPSVIK